MATAGTLSIVITIAPVLPSIMDPLTTVLHTDKHMVGRPLQVMLEAIERSPDEIYVWVNEKRDTHRSIRVRKDAAIQWAHDCAKDNKGIVSGFIGTEEVWLGNPSVGIP